MFGGTLLGGVFTPVCLFYSPQAPQCGVPMLRISLMYALADLSEGRRSFCLLTQGIFIDVMGRIHFAQPRVGNFVIKTVAIFACLFGLILGVVCAVQGHIIR